MAPSRGCPLRGGPAGIASVLLPPCQELVEFYQQNSLKDCFKSLDTTLQFPFKEPERRAISKPTGRMHQAGGLPPQLPHIVERRLGDTMDIASSGRGEVLSVNQGPFLLLPAPLLWSGLHRWVRGYVFILGKMRTLGTSRVLTSTF